MCVFDIFGLQASLDNVLFLSQRSDFFQNQSPRRSETTTSHVLALNTPFPTTSSVGSFEFVRDDERRDAITRL